MAIAIIWSHLHPFLLPLSPYSPIQLTLIPGRFIVWIFFILSGYSISSCFREGKYSYRWRDITRFYHNRALRILPLYYLTSVIAWIVHLYLDPSNIPHWSDIVWSLFPLHVNFYEGINTFMPTWFVGVIVHFYLVAPLLLRGYTAFSRNLKLRWVLAILLLLTPAFHYLGYRLAGTYDARNLPACLPFFLLGFFSSDLCQFREEKYDTHLASWPKELILVVFFILLETPLLLYRYKHSMNQPASKLLSLFIEPYVGALGVGIILIFRMCPIKNAWKSSVLSWCSGRISYVLEKVGEVSYGVFLWQSFSIFLFSYALGIPGEAYTVPLIQILKAFLPIVILAYSLAILCHQLIEIPLQKALKYKTMESVLPLAHRLTEMKDLKTV
jgi:peptidoglycan/LPS O-acetylase OafA/YrhL